MPQLYSAWQGSGYQARIRLDYVRAYSADGTEAIFNGTFFAEFEGQVSDSVNTWSISGDCADKSGSNLPFSTPSGGGVETIASFPAFNKKGDASVTGQFAGVQAVGGGTIKGTFSLDAGDLYPYMNNSNYSATAIDNDSFTVVGISGNGNGRALTDVQVEFNTSQTDVGADHRNPGVYQTSVVITPVLPNTLYYFRVRVNNGYRWSAWGAWKTVTTLPTTPNAPAESWTFANIAQTSVDVTGITVPAGGGLTIDQILVRRNTVASDTGATDVTAAGSPSTVNLPGLVPGTTYFVKVYAHNSMGYGPATAWKQVTTLPGVSVNVGGVWKNAVIWVNVGGVWKSAVAYVNVGGVWKQ